MNIFSIKYTYLLNFKMLSNASFKGFCEDLYSYSVLVLLSIIIMMINSSLWYQCGDCSSFIDLFTMFQKNLYIYHLFFSYFHAYMLLLVYSRYKKVKILPDSLNEYSLQIITTGLALLFGFNLSREINFFTLVYGIVMAISLTTNCAGQELLKERIDSLTQKCHYLDMDKQELRSLLARTNRQNKNDTIHEMSDIIFSLKEQIPNGQYLELMNKMQSLHI